MIPALPNPFDFSSVCPPQADMPAGAPPAHETAPAGTLDVPVKVPGATASCTVVGGAITAVRITNDGGDPWYCGKDVITIVDPDRRFVLDEERFLLDIEPLPIFLQSER